MLHQVATWWFDGSLIVSALMLVAYGVIVFLAHACRESSMGGSGYLMLLPTIYWNWIVCIVVSLVLSGGLMVLT